MVNDSATIPPLDVETLAQRRARLETLILDLQIARDLAIEQLDDREARACQIAIRRLTIVLEQLRLGPVKG